MSDQTPAGWFPDPDKPGQQRYWDGSEWTNNYAPVGQQPGKKGGVPTFVKVILGIVGVLVLIGACGALLGDSTGTETPNAKVSPTQEAKAPEPDADVEEQPAETADIPTPESPELTRAQENAIGQAEDYLAYTAFSRSGLIEQLEFEGYSKKDATLAVDSIEVDWNEQAVAKAEEYLDTQNFSRSGLIEQLEFEGFSTKQATYGVNQTGL